MSELNEARRDAGLSVVEAAAYLGRSQRTWRRWQASGAPRWAIEALRLRAGYLDALGWHGWKIHKGEIYAPDLAVSFRRGDLYRAWWDRQRLRHLEKQKRFGKARGGLGGSDQVHFRVQAAVGGG